LVDTVAGAGMRGATGDGGDRLAATFSFQKDEDNPEPGGAVALDAQGRLYVADTQNNRVLRIDLASGLVTSVAGDGKVGDGGDGGDARVASLNRPFGIAFDGAGNLYIADTLNNLVRKVVTP